MIKHGDVVVFEGREYVLQICNTQQRCFMPKYRWESDEEGICPYRTSSDITGVCNIDPGDPRKEQGILRW